MAVALAPATAGDPLADAAAALDAEAAIDEAEAQAGAPALRRYLCISRWASVYSWLAVWLFRELYPQMLEPDARVLRLAIGPEFRSDAEAATQSVLAAYSAAELEKSFGFQFIGPDLGDGTQLFAGVSARGVTKRLLDGSLLSGFDSFLAGDPKQDSLFPGVADTLPTLVEGINLMLDDPEALITLPEAEQVFAKLFAAAAKQYEAGEDAPAGYNVGMLAELANLSAVEQRLIGGAQMRVSLMWEGAGRDYHRHHEVRRVSQAGTGRLITIVVAESDSYLLPRWVRYHTKCDVVLQYMSEKGKLVAVSSGGVSLAAVAAAWRRSTDTPFMTAADQAVLAEPGFPVVAGVPSSIYLSQSQDGDLVGNAINANPHLRQVHFAREDALAMLLQALA